MIQITITEYKVPLTSGKKSERIWNLKEEVNFERKNISDTVEIGKISKALGGYNERQMMFAALDETQGFVTQKILTNQIEV